MIIIVGAGIAGLSLAWQLIEEGASVTILERAAIGSGASFAAAAYLEPRLGRSAMRDIEWASLALWPDFATRIAQVSGLDLDYRRHGQLRIAYQENLEVVRTDYERRVAEGWRVQWLAGAALREMEPHLSAAIVAGCYLPDLGWLDGRKLCKALAMAIEARGGIIHEQTEMLAFGRADAPRTGEAGRTGGTGRAPDCRSDSGAAGIVIETNRGVFQADKVVLCSAMGTNDIAGLPEDVPRCRPVKGLMLGLAMDPKVPLLRHLIKQPDGILCPRSDGRVLVGATHEEGETSLVADGRAIAALRARAARALPALADLPLVEAVCGIRSLVGDGLLRLGRSRAVNGLYYSLSHAGAGFIRAPLISREFAKFIVQTDAPVPLITKFLKR